MTALHDFIRAMPKVELHVHLEGAIRPETLLELARRNRVDLPADDLDGLRRWFRFTTFQHFIEVYLTITRCLRTGDDYELIAYEFGAEMARQNIRYAEVTFSPSTHESMGISQEVWFPGLSRGRARALADFGVLFNWVFDIVRIERNREWIGDYTLKVALDGRSDGVVALGLGGYEAPNPPAPFARWFEKAKAAGLASAPHAGETAGPESIWSALRDLHADRIGHGVRAVEDPGLVRHLADRRIPLEVCPTSNLRLGLYPSLREHPLERLLHAGVIVTLNSDDPPLFDTSLTREFELAAGSLDLAPAALESLTLDAARSAFLPPVDRTALLDTLRMEFRRLPAP